MRKESSIGIEKLFTDLLIKIDDLLDEAKNGKKQMAEQKAQKKQEKDKEKSIEIPITKEIICNKL